MALPLYMPLQDEIKPGEHWWLWEGAPHELNFTPQYFSIYHGPFRVGTDAESFMNHLKSKPPRCHGEIFYQISHFSAPVSTFVCKDNNCLCHYYPK